MYPVAATRGRVYIPRVPISSLTVPAGLAYNTLTGVFSWSPSTGGTGLVTYDWDIATDVGFSTIVETGSGITGTSVGFLGWLSPGTYYGRVRANDSLTTTGWSTTLNFVTGIATEAGVGMGTEAGVPMGPEAGVGGGGAAGGQPDTDITGQPDIDITGQPDTDNA